MNLSSSSQIVILGGNFSFHASGTLASQGVAFYDAAKMNIIDVRGAQVNATVRALQVM